MVASGQTTFQQVDDITQAQISVVLKDLPAEFSIDELVDRLILVEKIRAAVQQGKRGETYATQEARALLRQWSA